MKDLKLRPYANGSIYHHECLDGSGYPKGLTKKDIPMEAQIIKVADEYDAIASKRQYKSHVDISDTLKLLIEESKPNTNAKKSIFGAKVGQINPNVLKALFKVVIDDIEYEVFSTTEYIEYLESEIKRLETIEDYLEKKNKAKSDDKKIYYQNGIDILLKQSETIENCLTVLDEYKTAVNVRKGIIDKLHGEIKIIKKLKI